MKSGPVIIGYDASRIAERALRESAALLAPRPALVVTVWEPGTGFQALAPMFGLAPIDIRAALDLDQAIQEGAQRVAEQGASIARELGLDAEGLAVADDLSVADTLLRLVDERGGAAVAVGAHAHNIVREALLGSTTRDLIRSAHCPVIVVGGDRSSSREGKE